MRRAIQAILLVGAGAWFGACFDFDEYSFPEEPSEVTDVLPEQPGAGAGNTPGNTPDIGRSGASGCAENQSDCPIQPIEAAGSRGATCQSGIDCGSGFCVDGVCCEEACEGACAACNVPGQLGFCQGIPNDDACDSGCLPSSACLEYRPSETSAGGNCAARGVCRSNADCLRFPLPLGTPCGDGGGCNGSGACDDGKKLLGEVCASADECAEGFCAATASGTQVCCNQACNGLCEQCSALGTCTEFPESDPACAVVTCGTDDVCRNFPASPAAPACASVGVCVGNEVCEPVALRPAVECSCAGGTCFLALGASCVEDDECDSGFCASGVCCSEACDGACEQCGGDGECTEADGCECAPGDTSTCGEQAGARGDCATRTITCNDSGRWPTQQCGPQSRELCNNDGRDEDCNGDPRNGCECLNGTFGSCNFDIGARGVCADRGNLLCEGGRWPAEECEPRSDEVCRNGLDDDCDGNVDERPPCGVFDPSQCVFPRAECDALRCSRCNGCQDCADIVDCVARDPSCVTAGDPLCGNSTCQAEVDIANANAIDDYQPTEAAREYVECSCAR